jgi:hypothetical protein
MSRFLQSVLGTQEPMFSQGLIKLEKTTGASGVDARLIADITERAHIIMRQLGLDVKDTTCEELYYALVSSVRRGVSEPILFEADYVLYPVKNHVISFNLVDVIESAHHELPFTKHIVTNGQRKLRNEIVSRYKKHARTNDDTTDEIARSIGLIIDRDSWYN